MPTSAGWTAEELSLLSESRSLVLTAGSSGQEGVELGMVLVGGQLFVRAYGGVRSGWFRAAQRYGRGSVRIGDATREVLLHAGDTGPADEIDGAYRSRYGSTAAALVASPGARTATVRISPAPTHTSHLQRKRDSTVDMKLEVVILPVSDADRAKAFYVGQLGWRLDADFPINDGYRIVQVTPPGSECSVIFGEGLSEQQPGTLHGLQLTVTDIVAALQELASRGVTVSGPFRDSTGAFRHAGTGHRVPGLHPDRASYGTFGAFEDPDGNGWFLQEITERAPGR